MTIKSFFNRFKERRATFVGSDICWATKTWYYIDYFFALIFHGASINDYFAYGFYKLRHRGCNEYITYRRHNKIMTIANSKKDIHLCRNKLDFNAYFSDCLGREWIDFSKTSEKQFIEFASWHNTFFVKDVAGYCGKGITKKTITDESEMKQFYSHLIHNTSAHYIIEESIEQIKELSEFHPWSINTIRIVTLFDTTKNIVYFMNARIRMGNKRKSIDNFHSNGIFAMIDMKTGIVNSAGYDSNNNMYLVHPETRKQIVGFHIPNWEECKAFVEKSARRLPKVRYIGWDLVIMPDNTFCLIEANDNADHDIQQMYNKGLWQEYKQILKQIK